ncbi:FeoB-associated Cys-rich membrane protein [Ligilactobacillus salitolerans]|nr:FeoB-associated Cys-rich membrane protein [Ligilactobacillus salitolerans]
MAATIILGIFIFGAFAWVVYHKFIKHDASDCHSCEDVGCPLAHAKMEQKTSRHGS